MSDDSAPLKVSLRGEKKPIANAMKLYLTESGSSIYLAAEDSVGDAFDLIGIQSDGRLIRMNGARGRGWPVDDYGRIKLHDEY